VLSDVPGAGFEPALPQGKGILRRFPGPQESAPENSQSSAVQSHLGQSALLATNSATTVWPSFHRPRASKVQRRGEEWDRIRAAFGYRCAYCGKSAAMLVREHTMPRCRGGDESIENIVPACAPCNLGKGRRTPLEWFLVRDEIAAMRGQKRAKSFPVAEPCDLCGHRWRRVVVDTFTPLLTKHIRCTHCHASHGVFTP
jgi:5-methylcytosine-specific restriction endonuclease McrA